MKRTPLKRNGSLKRSGSLRRTAFRRQSRAKSGAEAVFRFEVLLRARGHCERCGSKPAGTEFDHLQAHHLVPRSRAVGKPWIHDAKRNGAALCTRCHDEVHHHSPKDRDQWILREPRP